MKHIVEICTMQILIVAATEAEIKPFRRLFPGIDITITGVGVPATIYHLQKITTQKKYDRIIQAGIAGCFNPDWPLATSFVVDKDCFADLGIEAEAKFQPLHETEFANKDMFPFTNGWLINPDEIKTRLKIPQAKSITVNTISGCEHLKKQRLNTWGADLESMEGAAFHYVCLQEKIPFLQLRAISNYVGERDKSKWNLTEAIDCLNDELVKLIDLLTNQNTK